MYKRIVGALVFLPTEMKPLVGRGIWLCCKTRVIGALSSVARGVNECPGVSLVYAFLPTAMKRLSAKRWKNKRPGVLVP